MLDQETSDDRQALLAAHRRRLAYRLRQQARLGAYAPPDVVLDIEEALSTIHDLKAELRANGVIVEDMPEDMAQAVVAMPYLTATARRGRTAMLQRVRVIWVNGLLEQSLVAEARIALGLEERPDAVQLPLNARVQELRRPSRPLPSDMSIMDVFDDMGGELLILGAPGAGKTTLLLELTRDLLDRAERDQTLPLPVVFNLSSWATKRLPLATWLLDELNTVYDVPQKLGEAWVAGDELLPLLDGLDEVRTEYRASCVAAINAFRKEHGTVNLAVCSRVADYEALSERLKLQGAVLVQPLTPVQINEYLVRAGDQLTALRRAIETDAPLRELAETPLMLAIMTLAYHGHAADDLARTGSAEAQRGHLFASYIARMFGRRGAMAPYAREQTTRWLAWLAQGMVRRGQSIFFIERLQPEWLAQKTQRRLYDRGKGLALGVLAGLLTGLSNGLGVIVDPRKGNVPERMALGFGAIGLAVLSAAAIGGLIGGVVRTEIGIDQYRWRSGRNALVVGMTIGVAIGVATGYVWDPLSGAVVGVILGCIIGLITGQIVKTDTIVVVEALHWSWARTRLGLVAGVVIGAVVALAFVIAGGEGYYVSNGVAFGVGTGLFVWLIVGLTGSELTAKTAPNQGIWRSVQNALRIGMLCGVIAGLLFGMTFGVGLSMLDGVSYGLAATCIAALLSGLFYGGYAVLAHLTLRMVLWRHDAMPLDYVRFLDYCAERIFLRKIGGGYVFVHRLLLEYFASLRDEA